MPEVASAALVDRVAAYLCDEDQMCPDCVTAAGRALKFLTNAGRLLSDGGETRTEWEVRWGDDLEFSHEVDGAEHAAAFVRQMREVGFRATSRRRSAGPWVEVTDAAG